MLESGRRRETPAAGLLMEPGKRSFNVGHKGPDLSYTYDLPFEKRPLECLPLWSLEEQ